MQEWQDINAWYLYLHFWISCDNAPLLNSKVIKTDIALKNKRVIQLDEHVYQRVFDAILEQRLAPGTKLNEAELAQIFSVSRTVIRKALVRLTHDGVVESRKNKGTTLSSVTPQEARAVFEARRVTEAAIVRLACQKITPQDAESLRDLVDQELEAESAGDSGKALRLSGEFHFKIADIAANPPLANFARNLVSRISLIVAQFEAPGAPLCRLQDEHKALVAAMESGNEDLAESLMLEHIQHIEDKIDFNEVPTSVSLREVFKRA
jgi:DNA-binding GntR family transcriptional regulator